MSRNPRGSRDFFGLPVALLLTLCLSAEGIGAARAGGLLSQEASSASRSRVVIVHDAQATRAFEPDPARVRTMVTRAVTALTGQPDAAAAWRSLVSTQDVVGIKVMASLGAVCGTRPAVVAAVVEGLLEAGVPARQIVIWDKHLEDLRHAGFDRLGQHYGVRLAGSLAAGYDEGVFYDTPLLGNLAWGDFEFGKKGEGIGRKSYVSRLLTREVTKIVHVTPLVTHPLTGVSGLLQNLALGSVDNTVRFEARADRLAQAVPEIYALPALSDRVALNLVDALLCQYQGHQRGLLHYSAVLNEIRVSRDPVALDVLSLEELVRQRKAHGVTSGPAHTELFQNASLLELGVSDRRRIEVIRLP